MTKTYTLPPMEAKLMELAISEFTRAMTAAEQAQAAARDALDLNVKEVRTSAGCPDGVHMDVARNEAGEYVLSWDLTPKKVAKAPAKFGASKPKSKIKRRS